ncbi:LPP20 family lipoprotein, partial [Myxococcota bacterium]|nr:LPP20 family lipoprotein [Myxococcota bacterium]
MKFRLIAIILAGLFTACGSSQKGNAEAGSSGAEAALHQKAADGTPAWVNRGSITLKSDDGRRLFFGIGVAAGIRNPAMLRTTADNRARAELGKLFSTYSASLMKDYANSGGEQHIEQAIKTFSGQTLQGVEVVDRYIAADGSLYALAQLDLQKAREAIAKAKELGVFKSYAADESLERIFDKGARKPAAPAPAPRVAADAGTDSGVENAPSSSSSVQSGEKPGWVDGECGRFPHSRYLCGVGFAKARAHAESGSYAALSRIFVAQIASVSSDFMGAYSKTGAPDLEVQSAEVLTKISTAKIFSGVQVMEVWKDKDDTIYALACLERSVAGSRLRDDIRGLDESVTKH